MSILKGILTDLRQRRLWPIPLALIAAIVAVPVVLAKSPHSAPVPPPPVAPPAGTPVAAITANTAPTGSHPSGPARDPFTQQVLPVKLGTSLATALGGTPSLPSSGGTTASGGGSTTPSGGAGSSGRGGAPAGGASPSTGGGTPAPHSSGTPSPLPAGAKPTPAPSGLTPTESYDVALSVSTPDGSVNALDPVTRLSPLPSGNLPLLVELGVLQGGNRVLFAVQPGTLVSGPGTCVTGPIDCEIISLGQDQVESASSFSGSMEFAVTGITAAQHPSVAAANAARQAVSSVGTQLLANSPLTALSLFQYQPQVGALVDLRNLTVGGN